MEEPCRQNSLGFTGKYTVFLSLVSTLHPSWPHFPSPTLLNPSFLLCLSSEIIRTLSSLSVNYLPLFALTPEFPSHLFHPFDPLLWELIFSIKLTFFSPELQLATHTKIRSISHRVISNLFIFRSIFSSSNSLVFLSFPLPILSHFQTESCSLRLSQSPVLNQKRVCFFRITYPDLKSLFLTIPSSLSTFPSPFCLSTWLLTWNNNGTKK